MAPINKINNTLFTGMSGMDGNLIASINKVDNIDTPSLIEPGTILQTIALYRFKDEIEEIAAGQAWDPSIAGQTGDISTSTYLGDGFTVGYPTNFRAWYNHGAANQAENPSGLTDPDDLVNGSSWGHPSDDDDTPIGWHCTSGNTTSGGTGPTGGTNDGFDGGQNAGSKYLYTETSTPNTSGKTFIMGLTFSNITTLMNSTSNNFRLKFFYHAFGSAMGDLFIYGKSQANIIPMVSNHSDATLLASFTDLNSDFNASSDPFLEKDIDLSVLKNNEISGGNGQNCHWIYFVYQNNSPNTTGYIADLAIDTVRLLETAP